MSEATEKLSVSLVFVGRFNPSILSPAWFEHTGLVSEAEVENATVSVIHPEISVFTVGDFTIDARSNKFSIQVESEPVVRVLDAADAIFNSLLPHTPMQQFGINYIEHFALATPERRTALGRALAPLEPWTAWGDKIRGLSGPTTSGMVNLVMHETYPNKRGHRRVEVQPSVEIEPENSGVFVAVNDHNAVVEEPDTISATELLSVVTNVFDESIAQARNIVDDLVRYASTLQVKS